MDSSNFRGKKKFISRRDRSPVKKIKPDRNDEEWNEFSAHEDFEDEDNKLAVKSIPEPEYDEEEVLLSWYDSDLNLIIDENFTAASPLHQGGFCFLQAGARATYGFFSGKVCFEVKVLQGCELSSVKGHLNTHLLRVGWSPRKASLALGSDHKSYGYDSAGRVSTIGEIEDYGRMFSTGDVVGAYMDAGEDVVSVSFTVNGEDMGVAYKVPQTVIQKEPLFPHILTKNISYECNFGKEKPWFPTKPGYTFVANVDKKCRIAGPRRPKSQSDCEVILMVGLPKSGKTYWVNEFREKHPGMYYVIDTNTLVDRMELRNPEREAIILRKTKVLGKLLGIAMDRRRNYILDQVNVVRAEQVWKLGFFRNHKRRVVSVVIPDAELKRRTKRFDLEDSAWMLKLKAKFRLPMMSCRQLSQVADKVDYVGLPLNAALPLVKSYNREAWKQGYKPYKNFRIPLQMLKEKKKMTQGDWLQTDSRDADFRGGGAKSSPPRARGGEEWPPPHRNRSDERRRSPSRKREGAEWHSPSRQKPGGNWPPARSRSPGGWPPSDSNRSPGRWPPPESNRPGGTGSPAKDKMDDSWPPGPKKRRYSGSPPRKRRGTRWGPRQEEPECNPPKGRTEEWHQQRSRSPGPRDSPSGRRSDTGERFAGCHSPPGMRNVQLDMSGNVQLEIRGNRVHADDAGDWLPSEGSWPMQGNPGHADWVEMGQESLGEFPIHDARDRSAFSQDVRLEGNFPSERRGDGNMMPHEITTGHMSPQDADFGGRFSHRGGVSSGRSPSPPRRMNNEFPLEDARFSSNLLHKQERVGDMLHPRESRIDSDILPQDRQMVGRYSRKDGSFPHQVSQFGTERASLEERGNMPPLDDRMGCGLSPRGYKGNNFPPPDRRVGGLSVHERLGAKIDDVPPREVRQPRSLSPHERRMGHMYPYNDRIPSDMTLPETEMGNFPPHGGRIDEIPPHVMRMRDDGMAPVGRIGENMLPHENRRGDSRGGRMVGNLPLAEHRIGDLPLHGSRMSDEFSPHDGRPDVGKSRHGSRRPGGFGQDATDFPFPHHERPGAKLPHLEQPGANLPHERRSTNLPHHESRMAEDVLPHERRSADFPFHEGRIRHGDLHPEREIADISHGIRMNDDMPMRGEVGRDMLSHRGRIIDVPSGNRREGNDLPRGGKMGEFPPNNERILADLGGRVGSGEFLPHEDLPPRDRTGRDSLSHREGIRGDVEPHGGRRGDLPPRESRFDSDRPMPSGKPFCDVQLFGGRHDEFSSHGGRPGGDKSPHGRPGDLTLDGRRYAGDFTLHRGRIGDDVLPFGRSFGGDKSEDVGMMGGPCEARGSSSDRWNRLPASSAEPRSFEWIVAQEMDSNKGNVHIHPGGAAQLPPHGRGGGGPPEDWKPLDDCVPDRSSLPTQQLQHRLNNRDRENDAIRFHDNKRVSPSRVPQKWPSPSRCRRPGSRSPNRPRLQSSSPSRRNRVDQQGSRQSIEQPGGRHMSPRRPLVGRLSPVGRSAHHSPEGRHTSRQSPIRGGGSGGGGSWRPPGDRHGGGDWQTMERENRIGQSNRLSNVDRGRHSPPRKPYRLEANLGDRPNRPFPEGPDGRDSQGPGFTLIGSIDKNFDLLGRDLRDRILPGQEQHGAAFDPSGQQGPSGSTGQFLGKEDSVNEAAAGWQNMHGAPHRDWQSADGGGGGSRWERVPEEEEELAPYEIPFNQADWDSNDPNAGIQYSASGYHPQVSAGDPLDERSRENSGSRNQETRGPPGSKGRGSVWQRVGGYVNDEKESSLREPRSLNRYPDHSSRGERGHRGVERVNKDREREYEGSRGRRGRDK